MKKFRWSVSEKEVLSNYYERGKKALILEKLPRRNWAAIKLQARNLGLKRDIAFFKRKSDVTPLLEETPEAYYWAGFIMADGYINHKKNRLKISLAKKDKKHLIKFAYFIKGKGKVNAHENSVSVSIQDPASLPILIKKFDFKPRKTYNPPNHWRPTSKDSLILSFIIGFIDGDGSIRKQSGRSDSFLTVKNHRSWLTFLQEIQAEIYRITNSTGTAKPKINSKGYAFLNIAKASTLLFLKNFAAAHRLPIMRRKWEKIDVTFISKRERSRERIKEARKLIDQGLNNTAIASKIGMSASGLSYLIKTNNLRTRKRKQ